MKVNAISSVEKHIKPNKLAGFPTTHDEAIANLLGQSDKDFISITRSENCETCKGTGAELYRRASQWWRL